MEATKQPRAWRQHYSHRSHRWRRRGLWTGCSTSSCGGLRCTRQRLRAALRAALRRGHEPNAFKCFRVEGRKTWYLTPAEIQRDLDRFLRYYHLERSHQGYRLLQGRTPAEALRAVELPDLRAASVRHRTRVQGHPRRAAKFLPWVHTVTSNLKTWLRRAVASQSGWRIDGNAIATTLLSKELRTESTSLIVTVSGTSIA